MIRKKCMLAFLISGFSWLVNAQDIKIVHGPYIQALSQHEVTIIWITDKDAVSWVEIAGDGKEHFYAREREKHVELIHGKRNTGTLHRVRVTGLSQGTSYRYRVVSKEIIVHEGYRVLYGSVVSTDVFKKAPLKFTTLDSQKQSTSFRVVNDIHNKSQSLHDLLEDVNPANTDFVVFNGDMISTVDSQRTIFNGFMDASVKLFASEVPIFYVRGNHELRGAYSNQLPGYFPAVSGKPYYTFRQGPVFFVVLDTGEDKPDPDIAYADLNRFDAYRTEQLAWLNEVVASDEFIHAPYRVVIMHIPPIGSDWHGARDLQQKWLPVLNESKIDVLFSAHLHSYKFFAPENNPEIKFPVIVNDDETYLDIKADMNEMLIMQKDKKRVIINKHQIKRP